MAIKRWFIGSTTDWNALSAGEKAVYEGNYTRLDLWEASEAFDLTTSGDTAVAEIFGTIAQGSTRVVFNGFTTDATNYIIVRARAGQEYDFQADTGAKVTFTNTYCWQAPASNKTVIQRIAAITDDVRLFNSLAGGLTVESCRLEASEVVCDSSDGFTFRSCLIKDIATDGVNTSLNSGTLQNCTILVSTNRGGSTGSGSTSTNVFLYNSLTSTPTYAELQGTLTTSGASDTSGTSAALDSLTSAEFVNYATGDYHAASGSNLESAGTDLSGTFTEDIDGETFTTPWDVGCTIVSAAATTTENISAGSFTLTGSTVDSLYNHLDQISAGSFTLTGSTVDTVQQYRDAISAGSFSLTGSTVDTVQQYRDAINAGSFTLTGSTVDSLYNHLDQIIAGSFTLTASTVDTVQQYRDAISAGSFTLSGSSVDDLFNRLMVAESGAFVLTGLDVTTTYTPAGSTTSPIDSGTFTLTGATIDSLYHQGEAIAAGVFTLTGSSIDSLVSQVSSIEAGTFTLTGSSVDELYNRLMVAESGSFTLSGISITTTYSGIPSVVQVIGTRVTIDRALADSQTIERTLTQTGKLS